MDELPVRRGDLVVLRPWREADAEVLAREIQDPEIIRWMNISLPYGIDDARRFVVRARDDWDERTGAHFVITDLDGAFVGYFAALAIDGDRRNVEITYWVVSGARGRGVASDAVRTGVKWVIEALAPRRVELGMLDGNVGSARVAEKTGFVLDRVQPASAGDGDGVAPRLERIFVLPPRPNSS